MVIPAYNEERRLPLTLRRLSTYLKVQPYTWDITVVSNGSTDDTDGVVRRLREEVPHLSLLSIPERGKGGAMRAGALAAQGSVVFLCDADLSMPPEELAGFLTALEQGDIVIGSREAPGARRYGEPRYRHLMGRVFNQLVRWLAIPDVQDSQCGFKAFRAEAARALFSRQIARGFAADVEVLYLARRFGYAYQELPIDWHFDADSRVRPGIDSVGMLLEVVSLRLRAARGKYGPAGAAYGR